jgi:hypothetical protein
MQNLESLRKRLESEHAAAHGFGKDDCVIADIRAYVDDGSAR